MISYKFFNKERGFRFDFKAIAKWCRHEGIPMTSMESMMERADLLSFTNLCFWAHKSAEPESQVTADDVLEWFNSEPEAFSKLMEEMQNTDFMASGEKSETAKKKKPASTK